MTPTLVERLLHVEARMAMAEDQLRAYAARFVTKTWANVALCIQAALLYFVLFNLDLLLRKVERIVK